MRFAAIATDHIHVFDHVAGLIGAGAEFAGYVPAQGSPRIARGIAKTWPDAPVLTVEQVLDDPSIAVVSNAGINADRAALSVRALRAGKDVVSDKPGATTAAQLASLRAAVAETGRIYSICFSERLLVRAAQRASALVAQGAVGRVVQTLGVGPHRLNRPLRPGWFFELERYGGIIADIASHQVDQFLHYTGSASGQVVASTVGNYGNPDDPGLQDFGQLLLRSDRATGYIRVDWFTPDALPTWGDGRLTILGTEGYIELRKYVDLAGRPGGDHLFLANNERVEHMDCSADPLPYFGDLLNDVRDRTETAMTQEHVFEVTRLALDAQARAEVLTPAGPGAPGGAAA